MADGKMHAVANLRVVIGQYTDQNGDKKNRYLDIGLLFSSDHGSRQAIKLNAIPVEKDWDGWINVYPLKREDAQTGPSDDYDQRPPEERSANSDKPF